MGHDLPPLKSAVLFLRELRHATTEQERDRILSLAESAVSTLHISNGLSGFAHQLLEALGTEEMTAKRWANQVRRSSSDGSFKRAKKELMEAGKVERINLVYRAKVESPGNGPKNLSLQTA